MGMFAVRWLLILSSLLLATLSFAADFSYLKIDHTKRLEVLRGASYRVVDVSQYKHFPATSTPGLHAVDASAIFNPGTLLFGFGLPNVYIGKVVDEHRFVKFAAKSFFRAESQIEETDGRTQSGVFLVPRAFPDAVLEKIIAQAHVHTGTTSLSCAHANAMILHEAGCNVGGQILLTDYVYPSSLFIDFLEHGLECDGVKIEFDIVASTPLSLTAFYDAVQEEEKLLSTGARHFKNYVDTDEARSARHHEAKRIKDENTEHVVLALPPTAHGSFEVRTGRTTEIGAMLRQLWGAHVIYEVNLKNRDVHVDEFLPDLLKSFPQANPSWSTILKREFLFNPTVVGGIHHNMACDYDEFTNISEHDFMRMLQTHSDEQPHLYNFVITDDKIIISRLEDGVVSWALSKHVLLANYATNVRFAGEFWKESDGTIYLNNNSGTYLPSASQLKNAEMFLQNLLPGLTVRGKEHAAN